MEVLLYGTLLLSFLFAICGIGLSIWAVCLSIYLKQDWLERVAEVNQAFVDIEAMQDSLKSALEGVHKLHVERQDDLGPIREQITVLNTKFMAVAANQNQPKRGF